MEKKKIIVQKHIVYVIGEKELIDERLDIKSTLERDFAGRSLDLEIRVKLVDESVEMDNSAVEKVLSINDAHLEIALFSGIRSRM